MEIKIMKNILDRNQHKADEVRELLEQKKITMINIISSPGSGKTTLLERTCEELCSQKKIGVIEGDITTDRDAQRLKIFGIPIVVINTEGGCHLDSHSIFKVLPEFDLEKIDLLFVENVGNLICPSQFDLGESFKIALLSTPEGDDKPGKYPMLFTAAKAVILNKIDLIPYLDFSFMKFESDLRKINPSVPIIQLSCTTKEGINSWIQWLSNHIV